MKDFNDYQKAVCDLFTSKIDDQSVESTSCDPEEDVIEDLEKARFYIEREINRRKREKTSC